MAVGAARNNAQTPLLKSFCHYPRVVNHHFLVALEFVALRFLECHRLGGDNVHQGPALNSRKNGGINRLGELFLAGKDEAAARAAQSLVRGAGDKIGNAYRVGVMARRNQSRIVRHIDEEIRTHAIGDFAKALPVDHQRVSRRAGYDHFGLVLLRQPFHFIVVDFFRFRMQAISHGIEDFAAEIYRSAVCQMPAVSKRHAEDGVARLQHRKVNRLVGLRTGMRLHIGELGIEQRFHPVYCQLLGDVHEFAAAVVAFAGIAFGVLVGQHRALRLQHCRACIIFRGDQLDMVFLALIFGANRLP